MKARLFTSALLCLGFVAIGAQSVPAQSTVPRELADGLAAFEAGAFAEALEHFESARARDDIAPWRGHVLFWSARTAMVLGGYDDAADTLDLFFAEYPRHPYLEEARYQRARIFFMQEHYEAAVRRFAEFLEAYPDSDFSANGLYWTGEALFALGRLDEAERLFAEVADRHPASFRVEAARYRLDIIEYARRERELLTLLQWSHEEYLTALDGFRATETRYQEALHSYRERLARLAADDFRDELEQLHARIAELEEAVRERDRRINDLLAELRHSRAPSGHEAERTGINDSGPPAAAAAGPQASDLELREALLSLKARALELQDVLLQEQGNGE